MFERSYLENIIRNAPIGIITTDLERRITFMSDLARDACRGVGGKVGVRVEELVEEPEAMQRELAAVLSGQRQRLLFESKAETPAGLRVLEFTATLLRDDAYAPIGLLLMCDDVTDKRETERKYETLMANSRDAVLIFSDEQILEANEAFARMVGRPLDACPGIAWQDFIHPDSLPMLLDFKRRRTAGDESVPDTYDVAGLDPEGGGRLYSVTVSPLFPDRGVYSMVLRDTTERRQLQERIAETKKLESLSVLAGGIAHDFNNLLSGVMGYASLLKTKLDPDDAAHRFAEQIETSATQAKKLTAQLLAFARGGQYEVRLLNLNQTVLEAVRILRITMPRTIKLTTRLTSRLNRIQADPNQMHQVITNLFTNAVEAIPSEGRITIRTENVRLDDAPGAKTPRLEPGPYVHLTVSDTGRGIPPEALSKIFEPFYSTKGVGHGLGLSAVYGIVHNHHGAVTVNSRQGRGTTLHVYLPASTAARPGKPPTPEGIVTGRETVLVVDDEAMIRDLLNHVLEDLGYKVILARDGEEGLKIFREQRRAIDCVVLDMVLPNMDGAEVYAAMRDLQPDVRVILCTGYSLKGPIEDMLKEGIAGVLRKPFQVEELSAALRSALDKPSPAPPR